MRYVKNGLFLILPYISLSFQYVLNDIETNALLYPSNSKLFIYLCVSLLFGSFVQIMKFLLLKDKMMIESFHLLFLILFGIFDFFGGPMHFKINPFTSYLAYSFSSLIALIHLGVILMDYILCVRSKFLNNRKEKK